jgi:hypothetical protein
MGQDPKGSRAIKTKKKKEHLKKYAYTVKQLYMTQIESYKLRKIWLKRRKGYISSAYMFSVEKLTLSGRVVYLLRALTIKILQNFMTRCVSYDSHNKQRLFS